MISASIELAPSSPKSGIVTKYQCYLVPIFRGAHDTPHTAAQHKREVVITDDGPQTPIKQLATAEHHRPTKRDWCGPLLLVLLGGIVTFFVFFACCMMPRFLGCASAKNQKTSKI